MQINIDNLIESWFSNASPKDQLAFLKKLLVSTASEPVPTKSYGLTTKQVMEKARKPSTHIKLTVLGKKFKSMKAAADHYGIPYHKVAYRKKEGDLSRSLRGRQRQEKQNHAKKRGRFNHCHDS
jgi:hypothetical protein